MAASYLQTFAFSENGYQRPNALSTKATFEVSGSKTSKQSQSLCLCASSVMGR